MKPTVNLSAGISLVEVLIALTLFTFIACGATQLLIQAKQLEVWAVAQEKIYQKTMEKTERLAIF